jgi:hypothetical protein
VSQPNVILGETTGLNTHGNEISAPPGSTSVADNVTFGRERLPERRNGFKDYSSNLPDFAPQQLLVGSNGSDKYLHFDGGLWYHDGTNWQRKSGDDVSVMRLPSGIWVDATETYAYICDYTAHAVFRLTIATGEVILIAGLPGTSGTTSATGTAARFNSPMGIWGDGTNLYVADKGNFAVRKIVIATGAVSDFAGLSGTANSTNGTGTAARFQSPHGIWSDGTNLYVSESDHGRVRKVVISSAVVTTLTSGLTSPKGLWVAAGGSTLYVATSDASAVRTINAGTGADAAFASGLTGDGGGQSLMHSDGTYLWVSRFDSNGGGLSRVTISGAGVSNGPVLAPSQLTTIGLWVFSGKIWLVGNTGCKVEVFYPSTGRSYPLLGETSSGGTRYSGVCLGVVAGPD